MRKSYDSFFPSHQDMLPILSTNPKAKRRNSNHEKYDDGDRLWFHIPEEDFEFGRILEKWESSPAPKRRSHDGKGKVDDGYYLFADLTGKVLLHFLASPFKVRLVPTESTAEWNADYAPKDETVDEGGPRRAFLDKVWKQLPELSVRIQVEDKKKKKSKKTITVTLFRDRMPVKDEDLKDDVATKLHDIKAGDDYEDRVEEALEDSDVKEVLSRLRRYYRAIGRIFFLALAAKERIGVTCLPSIVRNGTFELLVHMLSWLVRCVLSRIGGSGIKGRQAPLAHYPMCFNDSQFCSETFAQKTRNTSPPSFATMEKKLGQPN